MLLRYFLLRLREKTVLVFIGMDSVRIEVETPVTCDEQITELFLFHLIQTFLSIQRIKIKI